MPVHSSLGELAAFVIISQTDTDLSGLLWLPTSGEANCAVTPSGRSELGLNPTFCSVNSLTGLSC